MTATNLAICKSCGTRNFVLSSLGKFRSLLYLSTITGILLGKRSRIPITSSRLDADIKETDIKTLIHCLFAHRMIFAACMACHWLEGKDFFEKYWVTFCLSVSECSSFFCKLFDRSFLIGPQSGRTSGDLLMRQWWSKCQSRSWQSAADVNMRNAPLIGRGFLYR